MIKLSKSQTEILTAALQSSDGSIDQPEGSGRAVGNLIKQGLMLRTSSGKGPSRISITDDGRAAVSPPAALVDDKAAAQTPKPVVPKGKIGTLVELLRRPGGATVEVMMAATGWQAHSVRGAMSGAVKKGLGLNVASEKSEAGRIYRILEAA